MPRTFDVLRREADRFTTSRFGSVGTLHTGDGIEIVWVSKDDEDIDPDWFSAPTVDVLLVVQGQLRVEFADDTQAPLTLAPGQLLVLPPNTRCRAYRWPRDTHEATIFLAAYPSKR